MFYNVPNCPECNRKATPTGHSFPYAQWQCKPCIEFNKKQKELERKIEVLEKLYERINKAQ